MGLERVPQGVPAPVPDSISEPFWRGLNEGRLQVQVCRECEWAVWPPQPRCPRCLVPRLEWVGLSGQGIIDTFTIVRRGVFPGWAEELPYVVAVVWPVEYPTVRYFTNLYGVEPDDVATGMTVTAEFPPLGDGQSILGFRVTP